MTDREEGIVHDIKQEAGKNLEAMMAVKSRASPLRPRAVRCQAGSRPVAGIPDKV